MKPDLQVLAAALIRLILGVARFGPIEPMLLTPMRKEEVCKVPTAVTVKACCARIPQLRERRRRLFLLDRLRFTAASAAHSSRTRMGLPFGECHGCCRYQGFNVESLNRPETRRLVFRPQPLELDY